MIGSALSSAGQWIKHLLAIFNLRLKSICWSKL